MLIMYVYSYSYIARLLAIASYSYVVAVMGVTPINVWDGTPMHATLGWDV